MAERFKALVLKTSKGQPFVSSNLTLSANDSDAAPVIAVLNPSSTSRRPGNCTTDCLIVHVIRSITGRCSSQLERVHLSRHSQFQ
jgi:hypothetical protein